MHATVAEWLSVCSQNPGFDSRFEKRHRGGVVKSQASIRDIPGSIAEIQISRFHQRERERKRKTKTKRQREEEKERERVRE